MSYESASLRNIYLLFHYGTPAEIVAGTDWASTIDPEAFRFPETTVEALGDTNSVERALDIGCAVGRSSFELSKMAKEVIGIDFSHSFVNEAEDIRLGKEVGYLRYDEAHLSDELTATMPEGAIAANVSFEQGDAMNLRSDLGAFDVVHGANLVCRLPEPLKFLQRLPDLVKPGGKLVLATPCTWLPEFTPVENHPPGKTLDFLHANLDETFDFQSVTELPFLIREQVRKFQLSTSQTSVWVRKD